MARLATPETGAAWDDTVTAQQARAPAKAANATCFIYCSFEAVNDGPTRKQPLCLRARKRAVGAVVSRMRMRGDGGHVVFEASTPQSVWRRCRDELWEVSRCVD